MYESKNNSKFLIRYHIIFVCKYRKQLLIKLGDEIKNIMYDIAERYDFKILEMEADKDFLRRYYWYKNIFWTDGYFVSAIGEVSSEALRKYIENQG